MQAVLELESGNLQYLLAAHLEREADSYMENPDDGMDAEQLRIFRGKMVYLTQTFGYRAAPAWQLAYDALDLYSIQYDFIPQLVYLEYKFALQTHASEWMVFRDYTAYVLGSSLKL